MAGRSHVLRSPAYLALSASGKKVLNLIEQEIGHGCAAISLDQFMDTGMCRSAARYGIKQCEALGFVAITTGARRVSLFKLTDGWRALGADEAARRIKQARLPTPPRASRVPPKPVRQVKAPVEPPRTMQRRVPSLPTMPWQDNGR
jgi:hypothetical protein